MRHLIFHVPVNDPLLLIVNNIKIQTETESLDHL